MNIFMISVVAVSFGLCWGNPTGYGNDFNEAARDPNLQLNQNLANNVLKHLPTQEQFQKSHNQLNRQEYRRFGNDALFQNTPREASAFNLDHKTVEALNNEFKETSSNINPLNTLQNPSLYQGRQIHKSGNPQQHQRSDLTHSYNPAPQMPTFSQQETRRSFDQEDKDVSHIVPGHSQEIMRNGKPSSVEHRSMPQTGVNTNQNALEVRSNLLQRQFPRDQRSRYQNQGSSAINQLSTHDPQPQNQEIILSQNDMRGYNVKQNKQSFGQSPLFSKQEQTMDSVTLQEYARQSENNQWPSIQVPFLAKDSSFRQVQNTFESRRMPSKLHRETNQNFGQRLNNYISAAEQLPSNQLKKNIEIRPIEDAQFLTNIRSKTVSNTQGQGQNNKQDTIHNIHPVGQGLHQNFNREQAARALPQPKQTHPTPVLLSGTQGNPLVLDETTGIPSPRTVVFGRDSTGALNRASIRQHLKTPFTQYTYTHAL